MSELSMLELFKVEVEQQSSLLSDSLLSLDGDASDSDKASALEAAMRAAHSIKGAAKLVDCQPVADLAHVMEDNLVAAQNGELVLGGDDVDLLLNSMDTIVSLSQLGEEYEQWLTEHRETYESLVSALKGMNGKEREKAAPSVQDTIEPTPASEPVAEVVSSQAESAPDTLSVADLSMLELFKVEVEQQSAVLSDGLLTLEQDPTSPEYLESLMRAAHSIKGAARLVGVQEVVNISHVMEDGFVAAQNGQLALSADDIDVMLAGVDTIQNISQAEDGPTQWVIDNQQTYDELLTNLNGILKGEAAVSSEPQATPPVEQAAEPAEPLEVEAQETAPPVMDIEDMSMLELFKVEAEQQSSVLNEGLLALEQDPTSPERLEPLMRAAHSIKGAARLVGLQAVVDLAHIMEDGFVAAQKGEVVLNGDHIDVMLEGVDSIQSIAKNDEGPAHWLAGNQQSYDRLLKNLKAILSGEAMEVAVEAPIAAEEKVEAEAAIAEKETAPSTKEEVAQTPAPAKKASPSQKERVLRVSAEQIDRLMGLAGESMVESRWIYPFAGSLQRLKRQQTELVCLLDSLRDHIDSELHGEALIALARNAQKQASYCRELLADRMAELESFDRRSSNLSSRLHREVVLSRMRPFGDGIHGFPRMVRDVSRKLGKEVQLVIEGETTMVDRDILDKIEAPLNHIIRNAIDHGLESKGERVAVGKPAKGTIKLRAFHYAGMLSVVVEDDGRGVDLEKLRKKVVDKGLVDQAMADTLSDSELLDFLFLPSFSTRDSVSEISGRGVGLDVVHDVMQEMRGSVRATSTFGEGTRFQMQLPLTLSVIPALLVEVAGEPYAFPLARIDRILRIEDVDIQEAEGNQFVSVDGNNIGLVNAAQILGMSMPEEYPSSLSVIVLSDRNHYYGMVVERFVGERELVVQVIPSKLGKVQDISSAALMEDGSPILIVDVDDLIRSIEKVLKVTRLSRVAATEDEDHREIKRILVVDDSLTVREVERKLLETAGYHVETAVDGIDGLNALRGGKFDLLITDVDMPRMNGIELTSTVREDPQLRFIPIMMVSYKDREEDRMRGLQAGADYYLTKGSFHDESLRNVVMDLIGEAKV